MSSLARPDPLEAADLLARRRRISVDDYREMSERGVLTPNDRVELIDGVVVEKMTKNPPHIVATDLLDTLLRRSVPEGWFVSSGNPVLMAKFDSEPEPDLQIVRGTPRDYLARKHEPVDTALVIEVADSSYGFDRRIKGKLYASSGIPVYWILDLNRRLLEIHSDPAGDGYGLVEEFGPDSEVPIVLGGVDVARVAVREILP
ncbi:MAG: Uma2 family endonuclease [Isosphaeraceae bacterium]